MGFSWGLNFNLWHVLYSLNRLSNTQSDLSSFSRELQNWKAISARCWSDAFISIWGFWRFCECSQVEETHGMSQSAQAVLGETSDLILTYNLHITVIETSSRWVCSEIARRADWCVNTVFTGPEPHRICSAAVFNGYQFGARHDCFGARIDASDFLLAVLESLKYLLLKWIIRT